MDYLMNQQYELESRSLQRGVDRYNKLLLTSKGTPKDLNETPQGAAVHRQYLGEMVQQLDHSLRPSTKAGGNRGKIKMIKALGLTNAELSYCVLRSVLTIPHRRDGVTLTSMLRIIGKNVADESIAKAFKKSEGKRYDEIKRHSRGSKDFLKKVSSHKNNYLTDDHIGVTAIIKHVDIGKTLWSFLYHLLSPSMIEIRKHHFKKRITKVYHTEEFRQWLLSDRHKDRLSILLSPYDPMIVPPRRWYKENGRWIGGGYLSRAIPLMTGSHPTEFSQATVDALNGAQEVAFRINERLLGVLHEVYNKELPYLPMPCEVIPWPKDSEEYGQLTNMDKRLRIEAYNLRQRDLAKRLKVAHQIKIAQSYRRYEAIYFPMFFDFRSRMYYHCQPLCPQGDDVSKSLLVFSEKKPMGRRGFYWLCVHIANLAGHDKIPFDDRYQWALDNGDDIIASAEDPLGNTWWSEQDDKSWSLLAACFEYQGYLKDPEGYQTHLPVAMDGTCSGLQHYSMMLRDPIGAYAVNLLPTKEPQDIYTEVAGSLEKLLQGDEGIYIAVAEKLEDRIYGNQCPQADIWRGLIKRKIVKRATMTTPYGVTKRGIIDQLVAELRSAEQEAGSGRVDSTWYPIVQRVEEAKKALIESFGVPDGDPDRYDKIRAKMKDLPLERRMTINGTATWVAGLIQECIEAVVPAAEEAKRYIQEITKLYSRHNRYLSWTTPLGTKVKQHYCTPTAKRVRMICGSTQYTMHTMTGFDEDRPRKSKCTNSSAPNFIHSYDATHLQMTVLNGMQRGVNNWLLVHDSFATHPSDVDEMHAALRYTFMKLYKGDPLRDLYNEARKEFPNEDIPEPPELGDLDQSLVLNAPYLFS